VSVVDSALHRLAGNDAQALAVPRDFLPSFSQEKPAYSLPDRKKFTGRSYGLHSRVTRLHDTGRAQFPVPGGLRHLTWVFV